MTLLLDIATVVAVIGMIKLSHHYLLGRAFPRKPTKATWEHDNDI